MWMNEGPRDPSLGLHRFSDRIAGMPPDDVLRPGVPPNLFANLAYWADRYTSGYQGTRKIYKRSFDRLEIGDIRPDYLQPMELLDLVNDMLFLSRPPNIEEPGSREFDFVDSQVRMLNQFFDDARSLYTVEWVTDEDEVSFFQLVERVDSATREAVEEATRITDASSNALRRAWSALHALTPDADKAYRESVKAIECALGPLVTPDDQAPQLGKMKATLWSNGSGNWTFSLNKTGPPGKAPTIKASETSNVTFLVDLIERVYGSQARHGESGGPQQTYAEASAAVYAAVAIVGWVRSSTINSQKATGGP